MKWRFLCPTGKYYYTIRMQKCQSLFLRNLWCGLKNNEPVSPCGVFMEPVCPSHALRAPVWGFTGPLSAMEMRPIQVGSLTCRLGCPWANWNVRQISACEPPYRHAEGMAGADGLHKHAAGTYRFIVFQQGRFTKRGFYFFIRMCYTNPHISWRWAVG